MKNIKTILAIGVGVFLFLSLMPSVHVFADTEKKVFELTIPSEESTTIDNILYTIFKEMGYEISLTSASSTAAVTMVDDGEKDGLAAQTTSVGDQYKNIMRGSESISTVSIVVIARDDFAQGITGWNSLSGLKVGYTHQTEYITEHLPKDVRTIVKKNALDELYPLLLDGTIDVIVMPLSEYAGFVYPKGVKEYPPIDVMPTYTYFNKEYASLVPQFDTILARMKQDGTIGKIANRAGQDTSRNKIILNISSFYPDMVWEDELKRGIKSIFADEDKQYIVYSVNLNSKRILSKENRNKAVLDTIRTSFIARKPDVLVVSDMNALAFTVENYFSMFKDIPVVFCGINTFDPQMLYNTAGHFTGVRADISAKETVDMMLKLFPDTKNIFVLNDYLETGKMWRRDIAAQLQPFAGKLNVEYNENIPMDELLLKMQQLPPDTLVLTGFYFLDSNNIYYKQQELQQLLTQNCKVPIFGLLSSSLGYGEVGGKYVDGKSQAEAASIMAKQIIDGDKKVTDLPVQLDTQHYNSWKFDYNVLKLYHIPESVLPEHSVIMHKPTPYYESNPLQFVFLVFLFVLPILSSVFLVFFTSKLRKQNAELMRTQKNLHTAEELISKDVEIKEIKERLEVVISTAPVLYIFILDGKVFELNDYTKHNVNIAVGDTTDRLFTNPGRIEGITQALRDKSVIQLENEEVIMKDNMVLRFHLSVAKYWFKDKEAYILWGVDVEESELQKDIIENSEKDLKILLDGLPLPIVMVIPFHDIILYANNIFLGMFGFDTSEEVIGLDIKELYAKREEDEDDSFEMALDFAESLVREKKTRMQELKYKTRHGKILDALVRTSAIKYNGELTFLSIITDVSEENKRAQLLLDAADKEKEAHQLKNRFLVNMSHEIRTPMNAIIGLSQLALMKEQTRENNDVFRKINISSKNLLSIINDILDFSKIEAGKLELVEDEFNLEDIISNAFMVASGKIEDKKIEMLLDMAQDVNYYLVGDKTRLWQVLKNVLDNSAKYTEEGKIVLTVSKAEPLLEDDRLYLSFNIEDTGLGMLDEQVAKLFTPFEQFHNKGKTANAGTGLGMSIIKQLIELMGGTIKVTSEVNVGTKTQIVIGFRKGSKNTTMRDALRQNQIDKGHVLIADSNEDACVIMGNLLRIVGIESVCVHSGEQVVQAIQEQEQKGTPFTIVILDYMLDDENGIEIGKKIKDILSVQSSEVSKILTLPVYADHVTTHEIMDAGFNDCIEKPFVPTYFINQLCSSLPEIQKEDNEKLAVFENLKVILCEDNEINQEVASGMLEMFNIMPDTAANGVECLELLEKGAYDLVFMDILMPVMDGREATVKIRNSGKPYQNIPIIAMTANVMQDDIEEYMKDGMNGHVGKPLDFTELNNQLLMHMSAFLKQ